jgi:isoamylase
LDFLLPDKAYGDSWQVVVDTATAEVDAAEDEHAAGSTIRIEARGTLVLVRKRQAAG